MQRLGLAAVSSWMAKRTESTAVELLEAGCGTGRLLCQLADNFQAFHFTALDLSSYYLDVCSRNYSELQNTHPNIASAEFLHANMEELPLQDASKDVVVCAYVFHE